MVDINDKWVNIEDIAEYLSITEDTARTWVREGKLYTSRSKEDSVRQSAVPITVERNE